jgi:hypothetical protein
MQPRNILSGPYLDRSGQLRDDPAWFATALADPQSRYLPVWNSRNLVAGDPPRAAMLQLAAVPEELRNPQDLILLGRFADTRVFAYEIPGSEPPPFDAGVRFEELRMIAAALPADEAGLLAYARGMTSWRARHHYCGTCGAAMSAAKGGHVLQARRIPAHRSGHHRLGERRRSRAAGSAGLLAAGTLFHDRRICGNRRISRRRRGARGFRRNRHRGGQHRVSLLAAMAFSVIADAGIHGARTHDANRAA